ncbi:MAG: class I SAM-dependent methyltransferase [Nitrosopumilaceae archaeon]
MGIGNQLFFLWKNGYKRLEGFDLSENAITLANQINDKFNCGIKFGIADITKDIPSLNLENKVIFTSVCLEQLKHYMKPILDNLLKMKPRMVIHFEFSLEHSTKLSREYVKARDYQTNLLPLLKQMQDEDLIKIVKCEPLGVSSPVINLTFISWKPNNDEYDK